MPKKTTSGKWKVDIRPNGHDGRRFRKEFVKKHEAVAYENYILSEYTQLQPHEITTKEDKRRLSELVSLWQKLYGNTLTDVDGRMGKFNLIIDYLGDPIASRINSKLWADYRAKRLEGTDKIKAVKPATVNRDTAYLSAMFNTLISLGEFQGENPVDKIRLLKEEEAQLTYYNHEELETLLYFLGDSNSEHVQMVAKVCLATGARWEEAETLSKRQIKGGRITYEKTKSNKRRIIPISPEFEAELLSHKPYSRDRLFSSCLSAFRRALDKSKLHSPPGQLTHVLRHSFAVNFMEHGGNLVDLMNALGHSNIQTTAIYLRFAPTHLKAIPKLNPLATMGSERDKN